MAALRQYLVDKLNLGNSDSESNSDNEVNNANEPVVNYAYIMILRMKINLLITILVFSFNIRFIDDSLE